MNPTLQQVTIYIPENTAWTPGSAPITVLVNPDEGIAPTISSDTPAVATAALGTTDSPQGNGIGAYSGTVTAVAAGTATLSSALPGQVPVPFAFVTVVELVEGITATVGTPVLPAPPAS